jgi:hypothetical protein
MEKPTYTPAPKINTGTGKTIEEKSEYGLKAPDIRRVSINGHGRETNPGSIAGSSAGNDRSQDIQAADEGRSGKE